MSFLPAPMPTVVSVFLRLFGGVCSTPWTAVRRLLKTSARLNDFSAGEPEPGQKPDHGALVVGESVAILVVLASKAFDVILACLDRALFRAFVLVSEHVGLEVFEDLAAVGICASLLLFYFVATLVLSR